MSVNSIKLLTGNSHPELAKRVADRYVKSFDDCILPCWLVKL